MTAPLVIAKTPGGAFVHLYQGAPVPELADGELQRLKDGGFVGSLEPTQPEESASTSRSRRTSTAPAEPFPLDGDEEAQQAWLAAASVKQVEAAAEAGDDELRAALYEAELSRGDDARKTLLAKLEPQSS